MSHIIPKINIKFNESVCHVKEKSLDSHKNNIRNKNENLMIVIFHNYLGNQPAYFL